MLLKKLSVFLALMGIAGTASADSTTFIIWAYGSGPTILDALQGLSAFMSSSLFNSMFYFVVLVGFFGYGGAIALRMTNKWEMPITYLVLVFLFIVVFFQARIDISIEDPVNGFGGEQGIARDIPLGLALPAVVISEFGHSTTEAIEFYLSDVKGFPKGATLTSGNQFNFVAQMMSDLREIRIGAPEINASMRNYIEDCVLPAVYLGVLDYRRIMTAENLWEAVRVDDQVRLTSYIPYGEHPNNGGAQQVTTVSCSGSGTAQDPSYARGALGAWELIRQDLEVYAPALMRDFGSSSWKYTEASAAMTEGAIGEIMYWSKGNQGSYVSGLDVVNRAAVMNTFDEEKSKVASAVDTGFSSQIAGEKARAAQEEAWAIGARNFNATVGYLLSVLQAFLYAATPLIMLFAMIPGMGTKILVSFAQFLLALALWQPLLAIVSFLISSFVKTDIEHTLAATGLSLNTLPSLSSAGAKMVGVGGYLGTMVPVLAWGLVKTGGLAVTNFLSEASAPANSSRAGEEAASGNINMGNTTLNNAQANRQSYVDSMSTNAGDVSGVTAGAVSATQNFGGSSMSLNGNDPRTEVTRKNDVTAGGRYGDSNEAGRSFQTQSAVQDTLTSGNETSFTKALGNSMRDTQSGGTGSQASAGLSTGDSTQAGSTSRKSGGSSTGLGSGTTASFDPARLAGALSSAADAALAEATRTQATSTGGTNVPGLPAGALAGMAPGVPGGTASIQAPGPAGGSSRGASAKQAVRMAAKAADALLKSVGYTMSASGRQELTASIAQDIAAGRTVTAQSLRSSIESAAMSDISSREQAASETAQESTKLASTSTRSDSAQRGESASQKTGAERGGAYSEGYQLKQGRKMGMTIGELRALGAAQYGFNLDPGGAQGADAARGYEAAMAKAEAEVADRSLPPLDNPKARMGELDAEFAAAARQSAAKASAARGEIAGGKAGLDRPDGSGFGAAAARTAGIQGDIAQDRVQANLAASSTAARAAVENADALQLTDGLLAKALSATTSGNAAREIREAIRDTKGGAVPMGNQNVGPVAIGRNGQTVELVAGVKVPDGGGLAVGVLKTPGQEDVGVFVTTDSKGNQRLDPIERSSVRSAEAKAVFDQYGSGLSFEEAMAAGPRYSTGNQEGERFEKER